VRDSTHEDYAADAEAAQGNSAWLQAAALWRKAAECCSDAEHAGGYVAEAERCVQEFSVDQQLATIARRVLRIPTLESRNSDRLDFHEVGVGELKDALRLAYQAGREAR
jgi:hypothetical protein